MSTKTYDVTAAQMLNLIDESTRECQLNRPERRWSNAKVIEAQADVMVMKGVPEHIRSDNGPEFAARDLRAWLADTGAKTLYFFLSTDRSDGELLDIECNILHIAGLASVRPTDFVSRLRALRAIGALPPNDCICLADVLNRRHLCA